MMGQPFYLDWTQLMDSLTFDEYQMGAASTAVHPGALEGGTEAFVYLALGLNGEAGEVAEKIKKILRDKNGVMDENDRALIAKEIGDVLWYAARLADEIDFSFELIAANNLAKLLDRKNRGVLTGSGDVR